ncbi:MAG: Clp protease ClpP [Oscillospiraceae bacterium]|nr:Clp protease ClpP [Oscillospiraceae bacterium]
MDKFWKFSTVTNKTEAGDESTENVLFLNGVIASESWYGDEVTPKMFRDELEQCKGDLTVFINSVGGDCFAASEIYTALKEHKGRVTVKIDGVAASAASVVAMSGDMVEMSPTAMLMLHNPSMLLYGEAAELEQGIDFLNEVKESIINAYQLKTGLSRSKISHMMDAETWMNANAARDLGFCDRIMYTESNSIDDENTVENMVFDKTVMVTNTIAAMRKKLKPIAKPEDTGFAAEQFETRLNLLK